MTCRLQVVLFLAGIVCSLPSCSFHLASLGCCTPRTSFVAVFAVACTIVVFVGVSSSSSFVAAFVASSSFSVVASSTFVVVVAFAIVAAVVAASFFVLFLWLVIYKCVFVFVCIYIRK